MIQSDGPLNPTEGLRVVKYKNNDSDTGNIELVWSVNPSYRDQITNIGNTDLNLLQVSSIAVLR